MDSPKLRELPRTRLQSLAKREFVRAIGKTEDIIRRLVQKHPKGVPVLDYTDNPSASSAPPKPQKYGKNTVPLSSAPGPAGGRADPKGKGRAVAEAASPSPSSSSEALELLYPEDENEAGPPNTNHESTSAHHPVTFSGGLPGPSHQARNEAGVTHDDAASPEGPNPGWHADEEEEPDDVHVDVDYPKGAPNHYMVVDALRQFTALVNAIPSIETRVAESRCLLKRTQTLLEKAMPDARELTVTREYLETFLLAKMKQKRELWDGTAKMNKADRKLRMEWLRAERQAENEKRWKETNKLFAKHGLKPEPFSAFASQSDEEIIDSLQTTPTGSGSGSSKRSRDESVEGDTDGDTDTDGASRRKRARA